MISSRRDISSVRSAIGRQRVLSLQLPQETCELCGHAVIVSLSLIDVGIALIPDDDYIV